MSKPNAICDEYTVFMKPVLNPTYYPNIPNSPFEKECSQSQKIYMEIEQKLSKYGKCILNFTSICDKYLDDWQKFYSNYIEYKVTLIENTSSLQIEKL